MAHFYSKDKYERDEAMRTKGGVTEYRLTAAADDVHVPATLAGSSSKPQGSAFRV
jgi:hypothetical protein